MMSTLTVVEIANVVIALALCGIVGLYLLRALGK